MTNQDRVECRAYTSSVWRSAMFTVAMIVLVGAVTRTVHMEITQQRATENAAASR